MLCDSVFQQENLSPQQLEKQKEERNFDRRSVHFLLSTFCWIQVHRGHIVFQNWILVWTDAHCDETPKQIAYLLKIKKYWANSCFIFLVLPLHCCGGWTDALFTSVRCLIQHQRIRKGFQYVSAQKLKVFFGSASKRHGNKCVTYCVPLVQAILPSESERNANASSICTGVNFSFVERSRNDVDARFSPEKRYPLISKSDMSI